MAYRIDLQQSAVVLVASQFVASAAAGKMLCLNEDNESMVVEPDGTQVRWMPKGDPNWDSAYTQAEIYGDILVFRSANGPDPGVPRGYRMVIP